MASNFYTSSPVIAMPLNPANQYFAGNHYAAAGSNDADHQMSNFDSTQFTSGGSSVGQTRGSLAGRKRSRGDIHAPEEELEESLSEGSKPVQAPSPPKSRGEPIYGPGMTLIYPDDPGYAAVAESQSGTWVEETAERKVFELGHMKRPSIASRKSVRLGSTAAGEDDLAQLILPANMRDVTNEPLIDEATRTLGISWTRMDRSDSLRISQAAYNKWITNHYPALTEVNVWFENSAIPGYLVAARNAFNCLQEYYIFSTDLTEARLVTSEPSQLLPRLKMLPALHLAAPGGCIHAETDPSTASQNEANRVIEADANGMCAAHAMEMD